MIDSTTRERIIVSTDDTAGPYIRVPVDQLDVVEAVLRQNHITYSTLQQFVSIFEGFLFDSLRVWLLAYPAALAKRQLSGKDILGRPDKAAILDALVEKELNDVLYDRPANWFVYLNDHVHIGLPTAAEREQFAEVKPTRDAIVHGQGIANAYYIEKAGGTARVGLGQPLDIPEPYHQASWDLVVKLVRDIGAGMASKA